MSFEIADLTNYVLQFLVGIGVGVISGALGLGGGILMVPAFMTFVPDMETHTAKGTSLFIIIFVATLNAWRLNKHLDRWPWVLAAYLAGGSIIGSYAGAWITSRAPEGLVLGFFIVLLVALTVRTFLLQATEVTPERVRQRRGITLLIGLAAGLFGGATGTGGGSVLIPLALMAGIVSNERVVGLSNLVMVATAIAGTVAHLNAERIYPHDPTVGHVYFGLVLLVFIGAQIGSPLGKRINAQLTLPRRRVLMAGLLVIITLRLLYRFYEINQ